MDGNGMMQDKKLQQKSLEMQYKQNENIEAIQKGLEYKVDENAPQQEKTTFNLLYNTSLRYVKVDDSNTDDPFIQYYQDREELEKYWNNAINHTNLNKKELKESAKRLIDANQNSINHAGLQKSKVIVEYYRRGEALTQKEEKYENLKKNTSIFSVFTSKGRKKLNEKKKAKDEIKAIRKDKRKKLKDFQEGSSAFTRQLLDYQIETMKSNTAQETEPEFFDNMMQSLMPEQMERGEVFATTSLFGNNEKLFDGEEGNAADTQVLLKGLNDALSYSNGKSMDPEVVLNLLDNLSGMHAKSKQTMLNGNSLAYESLGKLNKYDRQSLAMEPDYVRMILVSAYATALRDRIDQKGTYAINDLQFGYLDGIARTSNIIANKLLMKLPEYIASGQKKYLQQRRENYANMLKQVYEAYDQEDTDEKTKEKNKKALTRHLNPDTELARLQMDKYGWGKDVDKATFISNLKELDHKMRERDDILMEYAKTKSMGNIALARKLVDAFLGANLLGVTNKRWDELVQPALDKLKEARGKSDVSKETILALKNELYAALDRTYIGGDIYSKAIENTIVKTLKANNDEIKKELEKRNTVNHMLKLQFQQSAYPITDFQELFCDDKFQIMLNGAYDEECYNKLVGDVYSQYKQNLELANNLILNDDFVGAETREEVLRQYVQENAKRLLLNGDSAVKISVAYFLRNKHNTIEVMNNVVSFVSSLMDSDLGFPEAYRGALLRYFTDSKNEELQKKIRSNLHDPEKLGKTIFSEGRRLKKTLSSNLEMFENLVGNHGFTMEAWQRIRENLENHAFDDMTAFKEYFTSLIDAYVNEQRYTDGTAIDIKPQKHGTTGMVELAEKMFKEIRNISDEKREEIAGYKNVLASRTGEIVVGYKAIKTQWDKLEKKEIEQYKPAEKYSEAILKEMAEIEDLPEKLLPIAQSVVKALIANGAYSGYGYKNEDDFNNMTRVEYSEFFRELKNRIEWELPSLGTWVQSTDSYVLRKKMENILSFNHATGSYDLDMAKRTEKMRQDSLDARMNVMLERPVKLPGAISYDYLKLQNTKADYYPTKRRERFSRAKAFWDLLRARRDRKGNPLDADFVNIMNLFSRRFDNKYGYDLGTQKYTKTNLSEEEIEKRYQIELKDFVTAVCTGDEKALRTYLVKTQPETDKAVKESVAEKYLDEFKNNGFTEVSFHIFAKGLDSKEFKPETLFNELMLCETEDVLLSKGCKYEDVFTEPNEVKYMTKLHQISREASTKMWQMQRFGKTYATQFGVKEKEENRISQDFVMRIRETFLKIDEPKDLVTKEIDALLLEYDHAVKNLDMAIAALKKKEGGEQLIPEAEMVRNKANELIDSLSKEFTHSSLQDAFKFEKSLQDVVDKIGPCLYDEQNLQEFLNISTPLTNTRKSCSDAISELDKKMFLYEEAKESNLSKYGFEGRDSFVAQMRDYCNKTQDTTKQKASMEQYNNVLSLVESNKLMPFIDLLEQKAEYWDNVTQQIGINQYLQQLYEREFKNFAEGVPQLETEKAKLFIFLNKDALLSGEGCKKSAKEWGREFTKFEKMLFEEKKVGGQTIKEREDQVFKSYERELLALYQNLSVGAESIEVLFDQSQFKPTLEKYRKRMEKNKKTLEASAEYKALEGDLVKAFVGTAQKIDYKTEFDRMIQSKLSLDDPNLFKAKLPFYIEQVKRDCTFILVRDKDRLIDAESLKKLEARKDIEEFIAVGKKRFDVDNPQIEKARRLRFNGASPVKYAYLADKKKDAMTNPNSFRLFVNDFSVFWKMDMEHQTYTGLDRNKMTGETTFFLESMMKQMNLGDEMSPGMMSKRLNNMKLAIEKTRKLGLVKSAEKEQQFVMYLTCQKKTEDPEFINNTKKMQAEFECFEHIQNQIDLLRLKWKDRIADPNILRELEDTIDNLEYLKFIMPYEDINTLLEQKVEYFDGLSLVSKYSNELISKYFKDKDLLLQRAAKKMLEEYMMGYPYLVTSSNADSYAALKKTIDDKLQDPNFRAALLSKSGYTRYGSVSSTERSELLAAKGDVGEEAFDEFLRAKTDTETYARFHNLSPENKKLFALALRIPGERRKTDAFITNRLINPESKKEVYQDSLESFAAILAGDDPVGLVVYKPAMETLMNLQGKLNVGMMEEAMNFVQFVQTEWNKKASRNWDILNDPYASIEVAKLNGDKTAFTKVPQRLKDTNEFKDKLIEGLSKDSPLAERVKGLDKMDLLHLVTLLQNRTILDEPTDADAPYDVVNEPMRKLVLRRIHDDGEAHEIEKNAASTLYLDKAMATVYSYQIKDDVGQPPFGLSVKHLKKDALKRTTAMDENLLEKALDLLAKVRQLDTLGDRDFDSAYTYDLKLGQRNTKSGGYPNKGFYETFVNEILDKQQKYYGDEKQEFILFKSDNVKRQREMEDQIKKEYNDSLIKQLDKEAKEAAKAHKELLERERKEAEEKQRKLDEAVEKAMEGTA